MSTAPSNSVWDIRKDVAWGLQSPEHKGSALRETLKNWDPLRKGLALPPGTYALGDYPTIFPGITVEADKQAGGNKTNVILQNSARWGNKQTFEAGKTNSPYASCFVLSDQTKLKQLSLISTVEPERQSTVFGFGCETAPATARRASLEDVIAKGGAWCGYFWHNYGDSCDILRCDLYAGNVVLMLGKSIKDGQNISVANSRLTVLPSLTKQGGSTTNPMDGGSIGACVRGGNLWMRNVLVNLQGQDVGRGPNMCAIQDHLDREGESTQHLNIYCHEMNTMYNPFPGRKLEDYYIRDIDCQYGSTYEGGQCSTLALAPDRRLRVARKDRKPVWPEKT